MQKVNELLEKVTNELWSIIHYESKIEFREIIDFYENYRKCLGLVINAINAQIIQYDGRKMPFSEQDIKHMIEVFIEFNKYNYDRLLVEALFVLDHQAAYQYLSEILSTNENKKEFKKEFSRWPHFEKTKEKLARLEVFL